MKLLTNDTEIDIITIEETKTKRNASTFKVNNEIILKRGDLIQSECLKCNTSYFFKFLQNFTVLEMFFVCKKCRAKVFNKLHASPESRNKAKNTMLEIYGVDNAAKSQIIQEKIKKTNIEKYGTERPTQSQEIKKKVASTCLERFGASSSFGSKKIQKKIKETNLKKYGVDNPWKSDAIKNKIKETNIEKHGVEFPSQSIDIGNKIKKSRLKNTFDRLLNSDRLNKLVIPCFDIKEYCGTDYKYSWKCCKCGTIFQDGLYDGHVPRCYVCFPKQHPIDSATEKQISDFIKSLNIQVVDNTRQIITPLELDIHIPLHNLAIEFDGIYWHSELNGKNSIYHLNKTNKCLEKKINLIHIFEDEWIEKQDIVKSIIASKLNIYDQTIGARKCQLKKINSKEAFIFYDQNHLQGPSNSKINIGLYYNNDLVSCLSLSKPRYNKKYDWEITRFANKLNTKVVGSFSKMFSYFKSNYKGSIITYSDRRYFDGSIYKQNGFTELKDSNPSYYYTNYNKRFSRIEFQKHKLKDKLKDFDPNLTEWENMQLNGWDRIWDCGNKVFEFN